jgi:hypothetical protein
MFMCAYHFTGDAPTLLEAYARLSAQYPADTLDLHVCLETDEGIVDYDTCPTREVFEHFSAGSTFRAAVASAGLPAPRVELLGEVRDVVANAASRR